MRLVQQARSLIMGSSLSGRATVLLLGTAFGQLLPLLAAPILTRLYLPGEFGTLGVFSAVSMSLIPLATLRYEYALLLARDAGEVADALATCSLAILVASALALAAVIVLPIEAWFGGDFAHVKYFLPLALLCVSAYQLLVYEATRVGDFRPVARTKLLQGVAGPGTQIALGSFGFGSIGLAIGFICSQAAGGLSLIRQLISPRWTDVRQVTAERVRRFALRYIRFPLLSSWAGVLQEAGNGYLAITLITFFYGAEIGGFIFLADRIVGRPLLIVTTSTLQASAADFPALLREGPAGMKRRFLRLVGLHFLLAALWCGLVALALPFVVGPFFGSDWLAAVPYVQVVCVAYVFQSMMHPASPMLQVLERQALVAGWEVMRCAVVAGSIILPALLGYGSFTALCLYVAAQAAIHILFFCLQLGVMGQLREPLKPYAGNFATAAMLTEDS